MSTTKRDGGDLKSKVLQLANHKAPPAFETLKPNRAQAKKTEPKATTDRPPRVIHHTNVVITEGHQIALSHEAFHRRQSGEHNRNDNSRVLREVLDFWIEHREQFEEWRGRRDHERNRERA